ncbi:MAG TPA: UDP-N-acetylmuramate dehydrogenase, partial [Stellaceae bacterium]|nr:UDP-N-acetylmuramate dehydrogenase [Stellaceae bacterium]
MIPVRGRMTTHAPLAPFTWFRVGGPADFLFRPADLEDLQSFLRANKSAPLPVAVIGVASNLLVRDGGIEGVVIRLGRGFADLRVDGTGIIAGAGVLDVTLAQAANEAAIAGLEFLSGIPGTVGGALRMNAGAYGREVADILEWAVALDPEGELHRLDRDAMGLSYRHCAVPADWIFVEAGFRGKKGDQAAIAHRMAEIQRARQTSQPVRARTGGSTFANPPGRKAWQLIADAGCRGLKRGDAMVSELHANFLINTGAAS